MPDMSSRTSRTPVRITSSSRSERYGDHDESRLPMSTISATSSVLLIWQSMGHPSLRRGRQDLVGLLEPAGRDRHPVAPGGVEIDRAPGLRRRAEGGARVVGAPDHLGGQESGL